MSKFNGKVLLKARKKRKFSRDDLAKKLYALGVDVTAQALSNYETGKQVPGAEKLRGIGKVLKMDMEEFFNKQEGI